MITVKCAQKRFGVQPAPCGLLVSLPNGSAPGVVARDAHHCALSALVLNSAEELYRVIENV
jgi:hypothetical protein